jgi:hypothetical protein
MTSSEKQPQQASSQQQQEQRLKALGLRRISPEEARRLGRPIRNDLIISPVPRDRDKAEDR